MIDVGRAELAPHGEFLRQALHAVGIDVKMWIDLPVPERLVQLVVGHKPRQDILYTSAEINRLYSAPEYPRAEPPRGGRNSHDNLLFIWVLFLNHNWI